MSSQSSSEDESAPELNAELEVSGKKRSLSVSGRPVQHVDSASKRSRISRVIRGAEELLASLNKDDGIEGELGNEENEDSTTSLLQAHLKHPILDDHTVCPDRTLLTRLL